MGASAPYLSSISVPGTAPDSLGLAACLANSHQDSGFKVSMKSPSGLQHSPASAPAAISSLQFRPTFPPIAESQLVGPAVKLVGGPGRQFLQVVNTLPHQGQPHGGKFPANGNPAHAQHAAQLCQHGTYVLQQPSPRTNSRYTMDGDGRRGKQILFSTNYDTISQMF